MTSKSGKITILTENIDNGVKFPGRTIVGVWRTKKNKKIVCPHYDLSFSFLLPGLNKVADGTAWENKCYTMA